MQSANSLDGVLAPMVRTVLRLYTMCMCTLHTHPIVANTIIFFSHRHMDQVRVVYLSCVWHDVQWKEKLQRTYGFYNHIQPRDYQLRFNNGTAQKMKQRVRRAAIELHL